MRIEVPSSTRSSGIALMVVMIVFIVLYMVVYHLHFYTKMEEKVAKVRHGDIQSLDTLQSVAQYVMSLLVEDLVADYNEQAQQQDAGGGVGGGGPPAAAGPGAGGPGGDPGGGDAGGRDAGAGGNFSSIPGAGGAQGGGGTGGSAKHIDHLHENIFLPNVQTIADIAVKILLWDNESRFDLNRLFGYAPLPDVDGVRAGDGTVIGTDDITDAVLDAPDDAAAEQSLREKILARTGSRRAAGAGGADGADGADGAEETGLEDVAGLEDEAELTEWTPPTEEQRMATVDMLARAIEVVISLNEDNFGADIYEDRYVSEQVAEEIVNWVIERRSDPVQNRIYHVSELLNLDYVTPELYYGPTLVVPEDGLETFDGMFLVQRDDYGDLVAEFQYDERYLSDREMEREQLASLQEEYGAFMDFPALGGLDASALTRGMSSPPQVVNEDGSEEVLDAPLPLGLEDIFTTFSTGKININTAPIPVLYALLPSLSDGAEGDANHVATMVDAYRQRMQDYVEDDGSGIDTNVATSTTKNLGQPRRQLPPEEDEFYDDGFGMDAMLDGGLEGESAYQDLETNYFTNLQQIELIDGSDEGPADLLRSDQGIDRVSAEDDSLLQRVINDYSKVMVFGSTYFTVELKAKAEGSPLIKSGLLVVKRDPDKKIMEVILWKELQK